MPRSYVTTMSELLKELAEHAAAETPEQKVKMREALLKFASGKTNRRRGEWIN